ncbi:two-component response regulator [Leptolyngbya sp. NIES-3755]|nr:two-component response regulator [Leptolyngbya sp. NIES-3755]
MREQIKSRILYVDDSHDNCVLFSLVLSEAGYEVQTAQSVATGLQIAQNHQFELYITDLCFPGEHGFDFIRAVRMFDRFTPIVICSVDSRSWIQKQAKQLSTQAFLILPIDLDKILPTITKLLGETFLF